MNSAVSGRFRFRDGTVRAAALAVFVLVAAPGLAQDQIQADKYQRMRDKMQDSRFQLFSSPTLVLDVNQFQCGVRNQGDTCSNVFNSPTGGGGFWPTGSPNQYMFNSGLNISGIVPPDAGFSWAGDTVGAFFFDATGLQAHGTPVTNIFSSLDPGDVASWPDVGSVPEFPNKSAFVTDAELFQDVLVDPPSTAASQQDSWVLYWDGDPAKLANRTHPMGILVEQRTLAWNFPAGNEATIYLIYNFTNVTDNTEFQRLNETQFFGGENELPDAGWRIDSIYVAFDADPDVTSDFDKNYSTAILPFNMGVAYEGEFVAPDFTFFPSLFRPPFFTNAPGLVGVKYLKSPVDPATGQEVGLTLFTVHENPSSPGAQFFDPEGVKQLWRYHSGNITPGLGDPACTFPDPKERRLCFLAQEPKDTRFFQASGPFSLEPGQSQTVVVAMFAAATVETPEIVPGNAADNPPGTPTIAPACPGGGDIRPIEKGAGWVATLTCPPTGQPVDQFEVDFVPGSLLGKALVAQTIFDNKFLLAFAPTAPEFFLVPGDDQVTVVWQESATEDDGDPFFAAASDPANPLFNPNYREFDVEGYRIFRGSDPSELSLVAQFDKAGSAYTDEVCETDPEFTGSDVCTESVDIDIVSPFIQFPEGGIVELADGTPVVVDADTALADEIEAGRALPMTNTGIPFTFVDDGVRNGFQYFYQVTAFDINSLKSGPPSLESAGRTQSTFPQKPAPNQVLATFNSFASGDDDVPLDLAALPPSIDAQTGIFAGPMPPTNSTATSFAPLVQRLLPAFRLDAQIDSVVPIASVTGGCPAANINALGMCWEMYMTFDRDGVTSQAVAAGTTPVWSEFGAQPEVREFTMGSGQVPADSASLDAFGIPQGLSFAATVEGEFRQSIQYSAFEGQSNRRAGITAGFGTTDIPANLIAGGSRWFNGDQETEPDPTRLIRVGHLEEADTVWAPIHHTPVTEGGGTYPTSGSMQCFGYTIGFLSRAADVRVTWEGGTFGEVRDVTHNVPVGFKPNPQATYGFLNADANGNGFIDWDDFQYLEVVSQNADDLGFCAHTHSAASVVQLEQDPVFQSVSTSGLDPASMAATGTGFGLYINGERYIFEMSGPPADGTVWTLRTYIGFVEASSGNATNDPSGYSFSSAERPPMVPGLKLTFESEDRTRLVGTPDLELVHTVPDPYYAVSQFDLGPTTKRLRFVNLPATATIRIYSVGGVLVDVINHDDPAGGGQATWDLRNRSDQFVASGVYFFHVVTPDGEERVGKFTVINFAN